MYVFYMQQKKKKRNRHLPYCVDLSSRFLFSNNNKEAAKRFRDTDTDGDTGRDTRSDTDTYSAMHTHTRYLAGTTFNLAVRSIGHAGLHLQMF